MKKKLITLAQVLLAILILGLIFYRMENKQALIDTLREAGGNWPLLVLAVLLILACLVFVSVRWRILMKTVGLNISMPRTLTLYFIGHFFNAAFPGVVGGDLPKSYYVAKETKHNKAEVISTVFIDRIIGLLALVIICTASMLLNLDFFLSFPATKAALVFNAVLLAGSAGGLFIIFHRNLFERFAYFRKLEENTKLGSILSKVYNAFRTCLYSRVTLAQTLLISIINHSIIITTSYCLGLALGIDLSLVDYFVIMPVILAISAVPATPGGLGTRELAAKFLLGTMGVAETRAVPFSLLLWFTMFVWSLVGGVVYIAYSLKAGKINLSEMDESASGE